MADDYVTVEVRIERVTPKAVLVRPSQAETCGVWLPRSTLHGADDRLLSADDAGRTVAMRVRQWIADREGLT